MSVVDDVKARLDIVDVVAGYVTLQKAGRNFKALCPFHQEKTPSFVVFPDTQTWRCFGACGEGGDVFGFAMKAEGWDFGEALRELAKRAGVELASPSQAQVDRRAQDERLQAILDETADFYHQLLRASPAAQAARDYVARRALLDDTVAAFGLGYAPDDWRQALEHLQLLGYTQDEILEVGVAIRHERGSVYDRFRDRLMIPIRDGRGHTVGFGARALKPDAVPKYLNSPQGPLFDKSHLLFGLDRARRAIRDSETVVVVEGYMDVMQAHQAGFYNVVAQMGTALTETQLRMLDRYASRLILALDPDAAGINATLRGLNVARQTLDGEQAVTFDPRGMMRFTGMLDMEIRVVSLPEGQDPDDVIRESPDAWERLIERAVPVADYVIERGTAHLAADSSYHGREQVARALLPILTATESDIQRNGNIQTLARRVRIDERTLIQWTRAQQTARTRPIPSLRDQRRLASRTAKSNTSSAPPGQSAVRDAFCLRMLIEQPERLFAANRLLRELRGDDPYLGYVLAPLDAEDFGRADYQLIFRAIVASLEQDELDPLEFLGQTLAPELMQVVTELREPPLGEFQRRLPSPLGTAEFSSIIREQTRIKALPHPDTSLFVFEALALRQATLEREWSELYFLQQDAQTLSGDLTGSHYQDTLRANILARKLISRSLRHMRSASRDESAR